MFCRYCGKDLKIKNGKCQNCQRELDRLENFRGMNSKLESENKEEVRIVDELQVIDLSDGVKQNNFTIKWKFCFICVGLVIVVFFVGFILGYNSAKIKNKHYEPNVEHEKKVDKENTEEEKITEEEKSEENTDEENTDEENTDEENTDEENTDEENTDKENTDEENTDEEDTDEEDADKESTDEESTEEKTLEDKNAETTQKVTKKSKN